ncbi:hypothetical protein ASPWEDRAFT_169325 [Aspergillus wentii DTO 134E9]|uniref:Globin-sensor domain-containing protein n=1 Tax=Aspergillus wentii DTO 134E9 TaxID=1073089 RepID=A0A1L9RX27_ASPWE|nr:uncharacterized protein ASPWEDRAFT_169325 [Aspergillus wentii DTO 134E9]KAI9931833.1 hypothetical protein MW887_010417 [Aspergillus wentii]OJJ39482.1 hypothetical protein ASPWEDRAFT_169325 [Aspergillus wentii DTO 134E9]
MEYLLEGRPVKHVDRKSLYTRLEARINYLREFLDFNSCDVEALASGSKYIKALIPAVVNIVYKKLLETDITARAFHTRSTADETPVEDFFTEESPQIKRRKMFLRWYLIKICSDPSQMEFWRYLNKVGVMHCGQERLHALNIEYIHIGALLGFIQDIFTEALMSHPHLSLSRKIALLRAINKIIWIQNDLFARFRVRDGEEFADEMSQINMEEEKEGYLGDKKILGEGSTTGSSSEDDRSSINSGAPSATSACPFAEFTNGSSGTETKIWAGK